MNAREMREELAAMGVHVPPDWKAARVREVYEELAARRDAAPAVPEPPPRDGWRPGSPRG